MADVRPIVVRSGSVEEARRDGLRGQLGCALAQPRDAAVVRAGLDVQAVHRAWRPSSTALANFGGYYPCPPEYIYPGDTTTVFHNWTTANLGTISVEQALKISCDTVFYQFGADFYDRYNADRLGKDATLLQDSLRQFGFGAATKLDLPPETSGLIPDPTWKAQFAKDHPEVLLPDEQSWLPGDDIQMAIGQGFVTVTPMQLAVAYSAIANGGKICRPHVVDHIEDPDGTTRPLPGTATSARSRTRKRSSTTSATPWRR